MTEVSGTTLAPSALVLQSPFMPPATGVALGLAIVAEEQLHMIGLRFECDLLVDTGLLVGQRGTIRVRPFSIDLVIDWGTHRDDR